MIEQAVYGYDRGHRYLLSSGQISRQILDAGGFLSDKRSDVESVSYCGERREGVHLLIGVWPDNTHRRKGCVISHMLVVPAPLWINAVDPIAQFGVLLQNPGSTQEARDNHTHWERSLPAPPPIPAPPSSRRDMVSAIMALKEARSEGTSYREHSKVVDALAAVGRCIHMASDGERGRLRFNTRIGYRYLDAPPKRVDYVVLTIAAPRKELHENT